MYSPKVTKNPEIDQANRFKLTNNAHKIELKGPSMIERGAKTQAKKVQTVLS
jgi:hypothetical protein